MTTNGKLRLEVSDYLRDLRTLLDDLSEAIEKDDHDAMEEITIAIVERNETLRVAMEEFQGDDDDAA